MAHTQLKNLFWNKMIDKIIYKLFGYLDLFTNHIDKIMFPKPKKKTQKKRKCKDCHCNCHCKAEFHLHHYDGDVCICDACTC